MRQSGARASSMGRHFVPMEEAAAKKSKVALPEALICLFIAVVMANGLIANYAPNVGINAGTFAIDAFASVLIIAAFLRESTQKKAGKTIIPSDFKGVAVAYIAIVALTLIDILVVGVYSPGLMTEVRIRFFYFLVAPAVFVLISRSMAKKVFHFFINCGVVFCIFAIAQSLFSSVLDSRLLIVQYDGVLGLEWSRETGALVLRSNALMGNAIEFGGVCVMLFIAAVSDLFVSGYSITRVGKVLVIIAGCYYSYSRIAFASLAILFIVLFFRLNKTQGVNKILQLSIIAIAVLASLYMLLGDSAMLDRFLGNDEFTSHSNAAHLARVLAVLQVISENFLFGTGLGTQLLSDSSAIADGWWFQLAAETGIIILLLYVYIFIVIGRHLLLCQRTRTGFCEQIAVVVLVCLVYFTIASFINTSFFGRADLNLFFVLVGCWLAARYENDPIEEM